MVPLGGSLRGFVRQRAVVHGVATAPQGNPVVFFTFAEDGNDSSENRRGMGGCKVEALEEDWAEEDKSLHMLGLLMYWMANAMLLLVPRRVHDEQSKSVFT